MFPSLRAVARRGDPETSHDAAASVANLTWKQLRVKQVLDEYGPMTDRQIYLALISKGYMMSTSGARTRRRELCDLGQVEWTGMTTRLKSGRHSRIWYSVDAGMEVNQYSKLSKELAVECPGCGHVFKKEYSKHEFETPKKASRLPEYLLFWLPLIVTVILAIILGVTGNQ